MKGFRRGKTYIPALLILLLLLCGAALFLTACKKDIPVFEEPAPAYNPDASGLFTHNRAMTSVRAGISLPDFSTGTGDGIAVQTGFELLTNSKNAYAYYNNLVDLYEVFRSGGDLISFEVLAGGAYKAGGIEVCLTDAYDAERAVSVYFDENETDPLQTLITAKSSSGFLAAGRDSSGGGVSVNGARTYSNNFSGRLHPNFRHTPFVIKFDPVHNRVYTRVEYNRDYLLLDLSGADDVGADFVFPGFTTGEVYIKITFTDVKKTGGIVVSAVGGVQAADAPKLNNNILLDMDYDYYRGDTLYSGAAGYSYPLPRPCQSDSLYGPLNIKTAVYKGAAAVAFNDYTFTPADAGRYTVKYTADDAYGNTVAKEYGFDVLSGPVPIDIRFDDKSYSAAETAVPPGASASGGHGGLSVSQTVNYNGRSLVPDKYGRIRLNEAGKITLTVTAEDRIGQVKTESRD